MSKAFNAWRFSKRDWNFNVQKRTRLNYIRYRSANGHDEDCLARVAL